MKKTLLYLLLLCLILLPSPAFADNFTLTSYYPAPFGNYKNITLTPQSALPSNNCSIGTIYANASDNSLLYYCTPTAPLSSFLPFTGIWTLNSNDLYLTDTTTPANKKVGIGTITPTFKLTLANDGGILADNVSGSSSVLPVSGAGTRLIWYPAHGAFRAGHAPNNEWNDSSMGQSSMAMGHGNQAFTNYSTIWGGKANTDYSTTGPLGAFPAPVIAGGSDNNANNDSAQILGGYSNDADLGSRVSGKNNDGFRYSTVGGGEDNFVKSNKFDVRWSTVAGGHANIINGDVSPINATVSHADYATISGGEANIASAMYTTISGGRQNTMLPLDFDDTMIVPPSSLGPAYGTIAGGHLNRISKYTTSSSFFPSNSDSPYCTISGGQSNTVAGNSSTISGGRNNVVDAGAATVSGGNGNSCKNAFCSVAGGNIITVTGQHSTALGGSTNTISGRNTIIPGGLNNTAGADYSLVAGNNMALNTGVGSKNTFLWGYSSSAITPITAANAFIIYSGFMGIRDITPAALLEINGNGSADDYLNLTSTSSAAVGNVLTVKNNGTIGVGVTTINAHKVMQFANGAYVDDTGNFMPASSREYKENITDLSLSQAMDAFDKLQPVRYNYKDEKDEEYLGFIAEDVPYLVADRNRQGLTPMDIAAVLTKVIAHQQTILKAQQEESAQLLQEIKELKSRFKTLKHQE